jgi:hypothetical protein
MAQGVHDWLVFLHVSSVAGFLLAHGASAAMGLRLRSETSTDAIRSLTDLSSRSSPVMYIFLLLIVITGVLLGFQGSFWGHGWIWVAIAVLLVTIGVMNVLGVRYNAIRIAVGLPARFGQRAPAQASAAPPDELRRDVVGAPRDLITGIGVVALLLLFWLMIVKPF